MSSSDGNGSAPLQVRVETEYPTIPLAEHEQRLTVLVDITGSEQDVRTRQPIEIALVLDVSGSMAGTKLDQLKTAVKALIAQLRDGDIIHVIPYHSNPTVVIANKALEPDREDIYAIVDNMRAEGGTNISDALTVGFDLLQRSQHQVLRRMFLYSDGQPGSGYIRPDQFTPLTQQFAERDIALYTFGIGTDINADLMQSLADQCQGHYDFVTARRLEELTVKAVSGLCRVLGSRGEVVVTAHRPIRLISVGNSEMLLSTLGNTREIPVEVGDLRYASRRQLILTFGISPECLNASDTRVHFGDVALTYYPVDVPMASQVTIAAPPIVVNVGPCNPDERNPTVGSVLALLTASTAFASVQSLVEAGHPDQAIVVLQEALGEMQRYETQDATGYLTTMLRRGNRTLQRLQAGEHRRVVLELGHQQSMIDRLSDADMERSQDGNHTPLGSPMAHRRGSRSPPPDFDIGPDSPGGYRTPLWMTDHTDPFPSGTPPRSPMAQPNPNPITLPATFVAYNNNTDQIPDPTTPPTPPPPPTFPEEFLCPISRLVMTDPVMATDNHTYERSQIEEWFRHNNTSPLTREIITDFTLRPNFVLRKMIEGWRF
eukprot:PhF_6_TR11536/c0_g1_i1/m.18517